MKTISSLSLLLLLLAFAGVRPVQAEDEAPVTYDARRATLPWPAPTKAIRFEGTFLVGGVGVGTVKLTAEPRTDAEGWATSMEMSMGGGAMSMSGTSLLDAKLAPVSGVHEEKSPDGAKQSTWKAQAGGVQVTPAGGEPQVVEQSATFIPSLSALLLFCRLSDFAPGTYTAPLLDNDGPKFVGATWTCGEVGTWGGQKARLVKGKRDDGRTLEAGFDFETSALLGVKLGDETNTFEFRRGGQVEAQPKGYFQDDAKTAQQAAVQAGLAFALADFDLLERIVHWPSVHAHLTAQDPTLATTDVESLKVILMAQFRATLKPQGQREALEPVLQATAPSLEATGDDSATVVKFGAAFRNLELTVGKRDGKWMLLRLPG